MPEVRASHAGTYRLSDRLSASGPGESGISQAGQAIKDKHRAFLQWPWKVPAEDACLWNRRRHGSAELAQARAFTATQVNALTKEGVHWVAPSLYMQVRDHSTRVPHDLKLSDGVDEE